MNDDKGRIGRNEELLMRALDDELEPDERAAYCGSIFYISADGRMDSNIAIRTMLCNQGEVRCWGGGGIVADSQWQQEYQETYDKVGKLLDTLGEL